MSIFQSKFPDSINVLSIPFSIILRLLNTILVSYCRIISVVFTLAYIKSALLISAMCHRGVVVFILRPVTEMTQEQTNHHQSLLMRQPQLLQCHLESYSRCLLDYRPSLWYSWEIAQAIDIILIFRSCLAQAMLMIYCLIIHNHLFQQIRADTVPVA